jgi:hypothetical protein
VGNCLIAHTTLEAYIDHQRTAHPEVYKEYFCGVCGVHRGTKDDRGLHALDHLLVEPVEA